MDRLVGQLLGFLDGILAADACVTPECRALVLGGKHLRARLLLACVSTDDPAPELETLLIRAAGAVELVHAASLVHDDIVDRCDTRRGMIALHRAIGSRRATMNGWYLVQLALAVAGDLPQAVRMRLARVAQQVSRGQFAEIVRAHDPSLLPGERRSVMEQKTASVFGLACELGGMLKGEDTDTCARRLQFGCSFGMVFQVADDVADLFGMESDLGRKPGSDVRGGVNSLPVAFAMQTEYAARLAPLFEQVAPGSPVDAAVQCTELIAASGAVDRCYEFAIAYARAAEDHLRALPRSAHSEWMYALLRSTVARVVECRDRLVDEGQTTPFA